MASICILSGNHLCHNPRVIKEADTLARAGFEVEVLGGCLNPELGERDLDLVKDQKFKFRPVVTLVNRRQKKSFAGYVMRVQRGLGSQLHRALRWENSWQLGYGIGKLFEVARSCEADLYIAHSEPALWVAEHLRRLGSKVAVDMEDWFSEDLLPEARSQRPLKLLRNLEEVLLDAAAHSSCPSRAMSHALAKEFQCRPPTVIYNAFEWNERRMLDGNIKERKSRQVPSIHWYSQTLGHGRGLEDLLAALPHLSRDVDIHLRGKPVSGFKDWLASRVPNTWRKYIFIHDLVPNAELLSRVAEHDVGFAGEMKYCRSRDLTVTNKILHYLLGGLAVVASDTAGQCEVAEQANGAVRLYPSGDSIALAEQLNALIASPDALAEAKAAALRSAETTFCWERQIPTLLGCVENALEA